ncbi:MAG: hypothetical protein MHMPM18_002467 [Marteilia pararefringens]
MVSKTIINKNHKNQSLLGTQRGNSSSAALTKNLPSMKRIRVCAFVLGALEFGLLAALLALPPHPFRLFAKSINIQLVAAALSEKCLYMIASAAMLLLYTTYWGRKLFGTVAPIGLAIFLPIDAACLTLYSAAHWFLWGWMERDFQMFYQHQPTWIEFSKHINKCTDPASCVEELKKRLMVPSIIFFVTSLLPPIVMCYFAYALFHSTKSSGNVKRKDSLLKSGNAANAINVKTIQNIF